MSNIYITKPRRRYIFGRWGIIDLLAIMPSLINLIDLQQVRVARILRVLRFLRLMRILKLAKVVAEGVEEIKEKKYGTLKMDLQIYLIAMFSVLIISSTLVFYAESGVPGTLFTNIPATMWWSIVTMTTVGYGDISPQTVLGKVIASIVMVLGYGIIAVPTGIVTAELAGAYRGRVSTQACPECSLEGHAIDASFCKHCGSAL